MPKSVWIMEGILGALFLGYGILAIIDPALVYRLNESWKSFRPTEPSRAYIIGVRISGGLAAATGLFILVSMVIGLIK